MMIAIVRLRSGVRFNKQINDTFKMLGLKSINSMILMDDNDKAGLGMVKKVKDHVTWGEISDDVVQELKKRFGDKKTYCLKAPRKGLMGVRYPYPRGSLGYREDKINDLIKRML